MPDLAIRIVRSTRSNRGSILRKMGMIQDLRYAARQMRRTPVFTLAAVLTLALGIGATTAMFSVADAVLLRPLPYPNSDRLVMVWNELSKIGVHDLALSAQDFDAFRADHRVFDTAAAFNQRDRTLIASGNVERVSTVSSTPGLLEMLGARTPVGRRFTEDDWKADRYQVAMISHPLFVRLFAANPAVVGQTFRLDDRVYTLIGVLSRDFEFSMGAGDADVWTPLPPVQDRRSAQFRMLALMPPGARIDEARRSVTATAERQKETVHPYEGPNGEDGGYRARVISLHDQLLKDFRTGTLVLMSAVGLVLLIACVNVANLLLARTATREKEISVRRALGASRLRLIRQWLTEGALLTMLGATAGLAGSFCGVQLLRAMSQADLPGVAHIGVDVRALLFTLATSAIVCLLFSLAPALTVVQMTGCLRGPIRRRRMSSLLITAEVAFALMLSVGCGLLLKSFVQLKRIDPGVRTDHLLTMRVDLSGSRYGKPRDRIRFFSELQRRLAQLPGIVSVSTTDRLPLFKVGADTRNGNPFSTDRSPWNPDAPARQIAHTGTVGLDYFRTMGIPLLAGRTFLSSDTLDTTPVAVINQTLARKFFPRGDAIGRRILIGAPEPGARWLTIVGVIGDLRTGALDLPPMPQFYAPDTQDANPKMFVVVRTAADPLAMTRAALGVVRQLDAEISPDQISTMEAHVDQVVGQPRFRTVRLMLFGGAALFLAAVGIYGVMAHAVVQRTNEIGIRMALGANATRVAATILADGLWPVAAGILLGLGGTLALARFLSSILYQVSASDPAALGGAALVLALVAIVACVGPVRRAAGVDPTVALKYE
jgi:putative ABC transport system permease protein